MNRRVITLLLLAGTGLGLGLVLSRGVPLLADEAVPTPEPGTLVVFAGIGKTGFSGDNGPATKAQLNSVCGLAVDAVGNIYIADWNNHRVRKVGVDGIITTFAGTGEAGFSGDNGPARRARLNGPVFLACDAAGNLFIDDEVNCRVRKVSPDGIITTVAGTGPRGNSADGGLATEAQLNYPIGVAVDSAGNLFICEFWGHRVRKVSPDGIISTVAGGGTSLPSMKSLPATSVALKALTGIAIDAAGDLYIADSSALGQGNRDLVLKVYGVAAPGLIGGQLFPEPQQ